MQWRNQKQQLSHSLSSVSLDDLDPPSSQTTARRTPSEAHPLGVSGNSLKPTPAKLDMSPALIAQTNWNFVEKLLKVSLDNDLFAYYFLSMCGYTKVNSLVLGENLDTTLS